MPEYSEEDDYYITSPGSFSAESNSIETDSCNEEAPDKEISYIGNKKVLKRTFDNLKKIKVEKIPFDIDGKKVYQVTAHTRAKLLEKLKDGRQWKKDSRATWSDFKEVRYRDCSLIVIISCSLGSQAKSILKKMGHAKLVELQVKRFIFLE